MLETLLLPSNHTALLYASEDEFVATLAPFVRGGVESGEGVIAVALPGNLRALREELGRTPPSVRFVDADDWYSRPPDTMGRWVSFALDQLAVGRPGVRIVGEVVWPGDALLQRELRRFESAATVVYDALPTRVICPYGKTRYPRAVIEDALATHRGVIEDGVASQSPTFVPPRQLLSASIPTLRAPAGGQEHRFEPFEIVLLAAFVEGSARRARLGERRVQQLVAAASELAANSFTHSGSPVHVTTWSEEGRFVLQLEDGGAGFDDPAVGYQPPYSGDDRWGLWLARRRADLLEVGRGQRGTVVRLVSSGRLNSAA